VGPRLLQSQLEQAWGLGFSNPSWSFTRGDTFNLTLKFAAQEAVRQRATAVDGQVMELLPDDRVALFEKIRRRSQLLVTAGGLSFAFELSGNSEALAALLQCVAPPKPPARNVKLVNPLVVQCALPQCTAAADSERRGEAAQFAADLTGRIGIYGVQVVGGNESPQLRADALWKAGPLTGAVSIVGGKMDEVAGKVLASDAQACRDDFFAGTAAEAIEGVRAMRILTSCAAAQVTSIYYLVIPRPQGGLYLLATMSSSVERFNSPPPPAQEVDGAIRATVVKVLSK